MAEQYRVVISGQTLTGAPLSSIKAEVGRVFRLQGEQLVRMLSGKPVVVSRGTTAEAAEKLLARLRSLDLEARAELLAESRSEVPAEALPNVESVTPPVSEELFALVGSGPAGRPATAGGVTPEVPSVDGVICPKCGEAQPKRTLCRECGLDMPRYRAAREAEEREVREARATDLAARRPGSGKTPRPADEDRAALLSLSFGGRLGRLDYLSASLLSTILWMALVWLAVVTGKDAFAGLGLLLSSIYALRCIALRLHDTGRTGWLALVAIVPLIGALMALALLFIGGEEEDNEYGPMRLSAGAGRAILVVVAFIAASGLTYRGMLESPEKALRFAEAMSLGQGQAALADEPGAELSLGEPVRYASNNRIDIYVVAGCSDCDTMRAWLETNGLRPTVYSVDSDERAAERLHSILGTTGRIQLPVLEVNGKVLSANPDVGEVHGHLRQASS